MPTENGTSINKANYRHNQLDKKPADIYTSKQLIQLMQHIGNNNLQGLPPGSIANI